MLEPDLPDNIDLEGQASDAVYRAIAERADKTTSTDELLDLAYAFSYVTYGRNGGRDVRIDIEVTDEPEESA